MNRKQIKSSLRIASETCEKLEQKFTEKRQQVLEILLLADTPLSAYELTDRFNKTMDTPILAMSVYRILGFLESMGLVRRLKSENKYIACNYLTAKCQHQTSMLLICKSCNKVIEADDIDGAVKSLLEKLELTGFSPLEPHIEIPGICRQCNAN